MTEQALIGERIVTKADELFSRYGIRSVTMDEIAAQLGMSKKTLYQHFEDKDELVDAVFVREMEKDKIECAAQSGKSRDAVEEIFLVMELFEEMFATMSPTLLNDLTKYHPKTYKKFQQHKDVFFHSIIRKNLERGIADGHYRADINVDIVTNFRLESMLIPFMPEFYSKHKYNLAVVEGEILMLFLHGLVTSKGLKLIEKYVVLKTNKTKK
jgi:TetR/AcrR family transcriptional regulator, cholesterol catabolism regulator